MTTARDPNRLIHAFLLEGADQLQDQVYDVVRAEIDQKRQRVVLGPWRVPEMNKLVPIGLGGAALVAVLFLGSRFIGSPSSNVGGPPSQSPASAAPTAAASAEPTATLEPSPSVASGLPEGPHLLVEGTDGGVPITVTIAAPLWGGEPNRGFLCWRGCDGAEVIAFAAREYHVYGDACHYSTTRPDTPAATVDEFVDALANQGSREASTPEDIAVGGYAGRKTILRMADEVDLTACDLGGDSLAMFEEPGASRSGTPEDALGRYSPPGMVEEVWAVDVDGVVVVLVGGYYADTPQNAIDEVRAILASATFE